MDTSGFLTYFAVLAALLALSSEEKKLEIAIKFSFKRWKVSCLIFLFFSLYFLFYDVLAGSGLLLPYSWVLGFDSNSTLLLLCVVFSIVFYLFIFNGAVSKGKVVDLLIALSDVNQSEKKLEHLEYVLNKNINVIKKKANKKSCLEVLINKLTTDNISKEKNPLRFDDEKILLGVREAALFRFIIEPFYTYQSNHPCKIRETLRRKLLTSRVKSYLFKNNPALVLDLLFLIREPLTVADIEKLTDEDSKFRFESDTYFSEQYSYNSIADFSVLLSKAIGNVEYLDSSHFFDSLEKYNDIHLDKDRVILQENHYYITDDSYIKNSFLNFYIDCIKCSSLEIIKNGQSYSSKFPTWYLTQLIQRLVCIIEEECGEESEFGSRAGYYIYQALIYQSDVYQKAIEKDTFGNFEAVLESYGHSFYHIFKNSKSLKIKKMAFEHLAHSYCKKQNQRELLDASLYGVYGNGIKSDMIHPESLAGLLPYDGDEIYGHTLSNELISRF